MEIMFIEPNVHAILSFELIAKSIYTKTIDNYKPMYGLWTKLSLNDFFHMLMNVCTMLELYKSLTTNVVVFENK
jgi:hypothetical protein